MIQKTTFELPPAKREEILSFLNSCKGSLEIGLYHLDVTDMEELFLPVIEKEFGVITRFERIWGHFMDKGGERPWHKHSCMTMLYYLEIPDGDIGNFVHEGGEIIPKNNDLYLFPTYLNHKIKPNNTDKTRWAIASNCHPEEKLYQELKKN